MTLVATRRHRHGIKARLRAAATRLEIYRPVPAPVEVVEVNKYPRPPLPQVSRAVEALKSTRRSDDEGK